MTLPRPFKTLSSEIAWSCPWFSVRRDTVILPDGDTVPFHVVQKVPAVFIIPVTADGRIVLIRNYRYAVDDWSWEIPAGGIEPEQTSEEAAIEELRQEIGGTAESLQYIGQYYVANGITNEVGHIFIAWGVTLGATEHEAAEVMEIHPKAIAEVLTMARANEISDGPSALALLLCQERLEGIS